MHNFVPRKDSEVSPPLRKKGFGCDLRMVAIVLLMAALSPAAWAQVTLNMGDILVADAVGQSVIAINGSDGAQQTVLTSGNLLQQAVGVGFLPDGYLVVADRINGLIRVNPATGVQELLSSLGSCSDPFAVTVALDADANAWVWVADSGYDVSTGRRCQNSNGVATGPNYAGRVIKVDPTTKKQYVMATGAACTSIPADGSACLNTSSVGSYITHPYGIAFDSRTGTIVVSDMSSFNGQGAIIRIDQTTGVQSLIWGPASEAKVFKDPSSTPLGCPMGITAEPNGNILATAFTYPTTGQIQYGCSNPGIYRVDLVSPTPNAYTLSSSAVGWRIPFGIDTDADSSGGTRDIVVADEGWKALYRVDPTKPDSFYSPPPFAQLPPGRQPVGIAIIKFVPKGGFLSAAPVVNITGAPSSSIPEGTAVNLTSSVSGSYNYSWTVTKTKNGATTDYAKGSASSLTFTPNDDGTYDVSLSVTPTGGGTERIASASVTATNVAPTITGVTGPTVPVAAPATISITANFTDPGAGDSHTCTVDWNDGTTPTVTTVGAGIGSCTISHSYPADDVYTLMVTVADLDNGSAVAYYRYVVLYNPLAGWVSGNGTIISPPGAYTPNPSLTGTAKFGFVSKYAKGANVPTGNTEFAFKVAKFKFKSTSYDWLVVAGAKAQFKGSGVIKMHVVSHSGDSDCENEAHFQAWTGNYGFLLTATDGSVNGGGGVDKFRMKIVDKSSGAVIYDNVQGASDDPGSFSPQAIASGKIVVHSDN